MTDPEATVVRLANGQKVWALRLLNEPDETCVEPGFLQFDPEEYPVGFKIVGFDPERIN